MNTISLRLYPETEKLYKRLLDECDSGTNGKPATADQFLNYLMECEQNPRKVEVSKPEDAARITELEHKLFAAESELTILRDKQPEPAKLLPTQIVFDVTESELTAIRNLRDDIWERKKVDLTMDQTLYVFIRDQKIRR